MELTTFAGHHRFKVRQDACGDQIVPGRQGHIFEGYTSGLGVCVQFETPKKWTFAKKAMLAAGLQIRQDGDTEGIAVFNPEDKIQARAAIKFAGVKPKRQISPEQKAVLVTRAAYALSVRRGIETQNAAQA
ncbi:MAG: hypothetical protein WA306_09345 [Candidatus Acidiferrales bacterium]